MAGISGPIGTLPGSSQKVPETECDDCIGTLSDEISAKRPKDSNAKGEPLEEGQSPDSWWDYPELRKEYDRRKAELPRATIRIQGETDSFGCEFIDMCEEHAKSLCAEEAARYQEKRCCDWCKKAGKLLFIRDSDEGSHGPVYEVCEICRATQRQSLQDELKRYQDEDFYE